MHDCGRVRYLRRWCI